MSITTKTKLLLLSLLFLSSTQSWAQIELTGIVYDKEAKPIEFASVAVKSLDTPGVLTGGICDEKGAFSIALKTAGNYEITVSFVGFADWQQTMDISASKSLGTVTLEPQTNELGEVIVTAERSIIEKKEDRLVFNVDKSPLKTGFTGSELLRRSPGILIGIDGEILMRNQNARILINGRQTNLTGDALTNYIQSLRSDDIKSIEIQTNQSASIDAENAGGVINIILKEKPTGFDGNVRADYTVKGDGYNDSYLGLNLNYGADKWNIYGAYNFTQPQSRNEIERDNEYFDTGRLLTTDVIYDATEPVYHNYQLGFVADAIKNHVFGLEFYGSAANDIYVEDGSLNILENNELLEDGRVVFDNDEEIRLYNATLNYTWTIDTLGGSFKLFGDYTRHTVDNMNQTDSRYNKGVLENSLERNNSTAETDIYSIQADFEKLTKPGIKLKLGGKLTLTDRANVLLSESFTNGEWLNNDRSTSFDYNEQINAGYISLSKQLDEKNYLEVGLRMENTDLEKLDLITDSLITQNYTDFFPSLYYSRTLKNNNSLAFNYSRQLRRPSFYLLSNAVVQLNDFRTFLGNPDLAPEYIHNFGLTFRQAKQSISSYYQYVDNGIIDFEFLEGEVFFNQTLNIGKQNEFGIDYNRFGNLNKWWYLNATAGAYWRKFEDDTGREIFNITSTYFNVSNNFKFNKTTSLDVSGYYIAPYKREYYKQFSYYAVDLMLQKSFLEDRLICRVYLNDVFNMLFYENESVFPDFRRSFSNKPQTRNIKLWVSYNFSSKRKINKRSNTSQNDARDRL